MGQHITISMLHFSFFRFPADLFSLTNCRRRGQCAASTLVVAPWALSAATSCRRNTAANAGNVNEASCVCCVRLQCSSIAFKLIANQSISTRRTRLIYISAPRCDDEAISRCLPVCPRVSPPRSFSKCCNFALVPTGR